MKRGEMGSFGIQACGWRNVVMRRVLRGGQATRAAKRRARRELEAINSGYAIAYL
jgi:hypothetical protein